MMKSTFCNNCGKTFLKTRIKSSFCSKPCAWKAANDARPRKTSKRYSVSSAKKTIHIPTDQLEVLRGCLLGDGYLRLQTDGFHRFSVCHSNAQRDYLLWKKTILESIFMCPDPVGNDTQVSIHSISHPDLTNLFGLTHRLGKKIVTRRFLNLLTPTSILFWFLDDGSRIKSSGNSFILCTDSFSIGENQAIKQWLWQRFRILAFIMEVRGGFSDKTYSRLRFRRADSEKLFALMKTSPFFKFLPHCLRYKFDSFI